MMLLHDALCALNEAAYAAAKAARGSDLADRLKIMALDTNAMVDGRPLFDARDELARLRAANAELIAANQALVVRDAEARELLSQFLEWWPLSARRQPPEATAARAWLNGGAK